MQKLVAMLPLHMTYQGEEKEKILQRIKDIIDRGNIAVFTDNTLGLVKKVKEYNLDKMGDLKAFYSNGFSTYVCPESKCYAITEEIPKDTALQLDDRFVE